MALLQFPGVEPLRALKAEFGAKLKQFLISMEAASPAEVAAILHLVSEP